MIRVHILGLPRSGTTALSQALAKRLRLPLVVEPIFLWTDGFRVNLMRERAPDAGDLRRIRYKIGRLDQIFGSSGGFVEKTPSSVFLAPVLGQVVRNSVVIVVTRDRDAIVRSAARKVFEHRDGNVAAGYNLRVHNVLVRIAKTFLLFRTMGIVEGVAALTRFSDWAAHNSILGLSTQDEVETYVGDAKARLDALNIGATNRVMTIPYERFRTEPNVIIERIGVFCNEAGRENRMENEGDTS